MTENELIKCGRCGEAFPEKFEKVEGSAYDSPVWETSYYITEDSVPDSIAWVGFHDVEEYFLCPVCRKTEEKEDILAERMAQAISS